MESPGGKAKIWNFGGMDMDAWYKQRRWTVERREALTNSLAVIGAALQAHVAGFENDPFLVEHRSQ